MRDERELNCWECGENVIVAGRRALGVIRKKPRA
jgi:hypothetical protein